MAKARKAHEATRQLVFAVSGQGYSLPAEHVLEVGRRPTITRVPNAPAALAGLMNFHGVATPVVRVSALVAGPESNDFASSSESKIIVYDEGGAVALLIDDVVQLSADSSAQSLNIGRLLADTFLTTARISRRNVVQSGYEAPREGAPINDRDRALLSFQVSGQYFALPLESVVEVLTLPVDVTGLPRSEVTSVGMISLREELVPLISLAALLGLPGDANGRRHVVIVRFEEARVGLVVDTMRGVVRIPESSVEPVPSILQRGDGDAEIDAIARGDDGRPLISILSPSGLFRNRAVSVELAGQAAENKTMTDVSTAEANQRFIVFQLGDDVFGLPIGSVDEIVQLPEAISRVPNAPEFVTGVINVRGKAVPVIDQRLRFDAAQSATAKRPRVIVVTIERLRAGFIVDSVSEILSVPDSAIGPAPQLPGNGGHVFDRVAARDGAMILLVDPRELLDKAERDLLERFKPAPGAARAL
ncbi:chemotaxis protein [Bosea caraganae]|uniref:Chemotaxis protein CheW n=1 Tax=Bosea caraganae TaxID=2763117 RepID=A0A370L302_9HYPH|nr:chemotaxis protein CheW [Bosea caraganae]RDJ20850.1 chemotaxis protein [Bosea caraganae]RDJ22617.1 chemotaxis protein [Bosea caraganae]